MVAFVFVVGQALQLINLPIGLLATSLLIFALAGLWLPAALNLSPTAFTGLKRFAPGFVLLGLLLAVANFGFADFLMAVMQHALEHVLPAKLTEMARETPRILLGASHPARIIIVLAAGVAAPIGEELFFRGWLQGLLARRYSTFAAIFWTAVVFSLTHGDVVGFIPRVELGLLFGFLRASTGSIYPDIVAHATHNLVSLALLFYSPNPVAELNQPFRWREVAPTGLGSLVATLLVLWLLFHLAPRARAKEPEPLVPSMRERPPFSLRVGVALAGVILVPLLLLGTGAILQHFERHLPGYGLVRDPFDHPTWAPPMPSRPGTAPP